MLEALNIDLKRDGKTVLSAVNMTLLPSEVVALVGPNGAGKSSLFQVISGDLPSAGEVLFEQKSRAIWSTRELANRLAILPQSSQLNFPFSAQEVVNIGRMNKSCSQQVNAEVISQVMACVDINHKAKDVYTQLSGGEKQRVQLARIFAQVWEPPAQGGRYRSDGRGTARCVQSQHRNRTAALSPRAPERPVPANSGSAAAGAAGGPCDTDQERAHAGAGRNAGGAAAGVR